MATNAAVTRFRNHCRMALAQPGYLTPQATVVAQQMVTARGKNAMALALQIDDMSKAGTWSK